MNPRDRLLSYVANYRDGLVFRGAQAHSVRIRLLDMVLEALTPAPVLLSRRTKGLIRKIQLWEELTKIRNNRVQRVLNVDMGLEELEAIKALHESSDPQTFDNYCRNLETMKYRLWQERDRQRDIWHAGLAGLYVGFVIAKFGCG